VTPLPSKPVAIKRFSIGTRAVPGDIAAAGGAAFVYDYRRGKLTVVDGTSGYVIRRLPAGAKPESIATDDADVDHRGWMVDFAGYLREFDTDTGRLVGHRIKVQRDPAYAVDTGKEVVVLSRRKNGASLLRVDPRTRKVIGKPKEVGGAITDLANDGYELDVLSTFPPEIRGYGPDLKKRTEFPIAVKTTQNVLVAVVGEMVIHSGVAWIIAATGDLVRVNVLTGVPAGPQLKVGREPRDIAISDDSVWVPSEKDGTVTRIDIKTGRPVGRPIKVPDINGEIAVDPVSDDVWLSGARDIVRLTP
jgi:DNA-binding beta-propeller fold protein YncE